LRSGYFFKSTARVFYSSELGRRNGFSQFASPQQFSVCKVAGLLQLEPSPPNASPLYGQGIGTAIISPCLVNISVCFISNKKSILLSRRWLFHDRLVVLLTT